MTMTLDEVRKTRFHIARRNGYEVTDVDMFVDKVEATVAALTEQNESLQGQLAELSGRAAGVNPDEADQLRAEVGRLTVESNDLRQEISRLQATLTQERANAAQASGEISRLQAQVAQGGQAVAAAPQTVQDPALIEEVQRLRQQLAQAQQAAAQTPGYDAGAQQELMQVTAENRALREQLERMVAQERQRQAAGPAAQGGPASLVVTTSPEASAAVVRLVQLATEQAEHLVSEAAREAGRRSQQIDLEIQRAKQEADEYIMRVKAEAKLTADDLTRRSTEEAQQRMEQANQAARALTGEAQARAERTDNEARVGAERLVQEAQQRANMIDAEAAARRAELFRALEAERDDLLTKVEKLKNYEASFRQTMTAYLKSQIERLDTYQFRPDTTPELLQVPQARSAQEWAVDQTVGHTPRLDALLRDLNTR
jgi:DivIVA domain-containing protein